VALIRKQKPDWQKGKMNGIGGKVEAGETPNVAMTREFHEEAGCVSPPDAWSGFARLQSLDADTRERFVVHCLATIGDVTLARTMEEEAIEIVDFAAISSMSEQMIENLPWLLHLAYDHLCDGRPAFAVVTYP
jgi:8-oxo-dGTP diphosphatase